MNATVLAAIAGALAGLVTGAVSALAAPWANWGVEKRRATRRERRDLIDSWERMVAEQLRSETANLDEMIRSDEYLSIRSYLDFGLVAKLEARRPVVIIVEGRTGLGGDPKLHSVTKRIEELKREWGFS